MHHRNRHCAATLIHCTCITSSSFAGNDELVTVEDSIDVGNVLWIFYDCLSLKLPVCKKKGTEIQDFTQHLLKIARACRGVRPLNPRNSTFYRYLLVLNDRRHSRATSSAPGSFHLIDNKVIMPN